ncbi:MAG TPA: metallophosphoesterase [Polyangiaceae bacterium]|nr:metallophosphoesterase [Polyangiaceae bacterium]
MAFCVPRSRSLAALVLGCAALSLVACSERPERSNPPRNDDQPTASRHAPAAPKAISDDPVPSEEPCVATDCADAALTTRFVIIGDYGLSGPAEANVAALLTSLQPDFVITTGDNNYPLGEAATIDENIGRYFHAFIAPYRGKFGSGAKENRFFPSLGNHDWYTAGAEPYLDYFTLPNNERYYQVTRGNVQLFALDSDPAEPDGTAADSKQARWLSAQLGAALAPWRVVFFHHPPYSSSSVHGSTLEMRWPFAEWGASIVYAGHDHTYERLAVDGLPYIVNGVGGNELYELGEPLPETVVRHADVHGLVLVTATATEFVSRFLDERGLELDVLSLRK